MIINNKMHHFTFWPVLLLVPLLHCQTTLHLIPHSTISSAFEIPFNILSYSPQPTPTHAILLPPAGNNSYCNLVPKFPIPRTGLPNPSIQVALFVIGGDCSLHLQAVNAQKVGADLVIIQSDNDTSIDQAKLQQKNTKLKIPTLIVSSEHGATILNYIQNETQNLQIIVRKKTKPIGIDDSLRNISDITLPEVYFNIEEKQGFAYLSEFYHHHMFDELAPTLELQHKIIFTSSQKSSHPGVYCLEGKSIGDQTFCYEPSRRHSGKTIMLEQIRSLGILYRLGASMWWKYVDLFRNNICYESLDVSDCALKTIKQLGVSSVRLEEVNKYMQESQLNPIVLFSRESFIMARATVSRNYTYHPQIKRTLASLCKPQQGRFTKEQCHQILRTNKHVNHDRYPQPYRFTEPNYVVEANKTEQFLFYLSDSEGRLAHQVIVILSPSYDPFDEIGYLDLLGLVQKRKVKQFYGNVRSIEREVNKTSAMFKSKKQGLNQILLITEERIPQMKLHFQIEFNFHKHYTFHVIPHYSGGHPEISLPFLRQTVHYIQHSYKKITLYFQWQVGSTNISMYQLSIDYDHLNTNNLTLFKSPQQMINTNNSDNLLTKAVGQRSYKSTITGRTRLTYYFKKQDIEGYFNRQLCQSQQKPIHKLSCPFYLYANSEVPSLLQIKTKGLVKDLVMLPYNQAPRELEIKFSFVQSVTIKDFRFQPTINIRARTEWNHSQGTLLRHEYRVCKPQCACAADQILKSQRHTFLFNTTKLNFTIDETQDGVLETSFRLYDAPNMPRRHLRPKEVTIYVIYSNAKPAKNVTLTQSIIVQQQPRQSIAINSALEFSSSAITEIDSVSLRQEQKWSYIVGIPSVKTNIHSHFRAVHHNGTEYFFQKDLRTTRSFLSHYNANLSPLEYYHLSEIDSLTLSNLTFFVNQQLSSQTNYFTPMTGVAILNHHSNQTCTFPVPNHQSILSYASLKYRDYADFHLKSHQYKYAGSSSPDNKVILSFDVLNRSMESLIEVCLWSQNQTAWQGRCYSSNSLVKWRSSDGYGVTRGILCPLNLFFVRVRVNLGELVPLDTLNNIAKNEISYAYYHDLWSIIQFKHPYLTAPVELSIMSIEKGNHLVQELQYSQQLSHSDEQQEEKHAVDKQKKQNSTFEKPEKDRSHSTDDIQANKNAQNLNNSMHNTSLEDDKKNQEPNISNTSSQQVIKKDQIIQKQKELKQLNKQETMNQVQKPVQSIKQKQKSFNIDKNQSQSPTPNIRTQSEQEAQTQVQLICVVVLLLLVIVGLLIRVWVLQKRLNKLSQAERCPDQNSIQVTNLTQA